MNALNETIKDIILNRVLEHPNTLGEVLLEYVFPGEGRGCYSNFNVRESFKEYSDGKEFFAKLILGYHSDLFSEEEIEQDKARISCYREAESDIEVAWLWDGDGRLIFKLGKILIENTDIKKSYTWDFI
jgi:hypothetical protein